QERAHFTLEFLMTKCLRSHWTLGACSRFIGVRHSLLAVARAFGVFCYFFLQPFRQCRLPRSEHRRDWQLAPIMVLLSQPAETSRADSFEHAGQRQSAPPTPVLADQGNAQGCRLCRRLWFPFAARVQHFRYTAPDESRTLICYPETTPTRTGFERVL